MSRSTVKNVQNVGGEVVQGGAAVEEWQESGELGWGVVDDVEGSKVGCEVGQGEGMKKIRRSEAENELSIWRSTSVMEG